MTLGIHRVKVWVSVLLFPFPSPHNIIVCSSTLRQTTSLAIKMMNRNQVAGHLGAANNPQVSSGAQHSSRQAVMNSAAQGNSGRSQSSIAGQIGATTNPAFSSSTQHAARQGVMNAAAKK